MLYLHDLKRSGSGVDELNSDNRHLRRLLRCHAGQWRRARMARSARVGCRGLVLQVPMPQLVGDLPAARVTLQELIDIIAFVRTDVPERHFGRGDERRHKVYPRPAIWALRAGGDREGDGAVHTPRLFAPHDQKHKLASCNNNGNSADTNKTDMVMAHGTATGQKGGNTASATSRRISPGTP